MSTFQFRKSAEAESSGSHEERIEYLPEPRNIEAKIVQLEVKIESLCEKVKNHQESRKWIVGTTATAIVITIALFTFLFNAWKYYEDAYREMQNRYYKELIDLRKEIISRPSQSDDQNSASQTKRPAEMKK